MNAPQQPSTGPQTPETGQTDPWGDPDQFHGLTRVEHGNVSRVDPSFDSTWDDLTQLRWHAAVIQHDTTYPRRIAVRESTYSRKIGGRWIRQIGYYDITMNQPGHSSSGPHTFQAAWDYLNGIETGLIAARS